MTFQARDDLEVEALRTDRYLDALLAAGDRRASDAPAASELDDTVRWAATRLRRELGRVHPSFRFEERLAARLAEVAAAMGVPAAAGAEGVRVPLGRMPIDPMDPVDPATGHPRREPRDPDDPDEGDPDEGGPDAQPGLPRPILLGGAMASAALSLAGAAYIAWRRARPPASPVAWAVRAARQRRLD